MRYLITKLWHNIKQEHPDLESQYECEDFYWKRLEKRKSPTYIKVVEELQKWIISNIGFMKIDKKLNGMKVNKRQSDEFKKGDQIGLLMKIKTLERPEIYQLSGKDQNYV